MNSITSQVFNSFPKFKLIPLCCDCESLDEKQSRSVEGWISCKCLKYGNWCWFFADACEEGFNIKKVLKSG